MSFKSIVAGVKARLDLCSADAFASMRVAGESTPCHVYGISGQITWMMPATGGSKAHWTIVLEVQSIADTLDDALDAANDLISQFSGGSFTDVTNSCKLTVQSIECGVGSEMPDDGQQDAERYVNTTITIQAVET